MHRFVDASLAAWADGKRRKPLIVRGARQVGKTYSIKMLGQKRFANTVLVDLERNRRWHRVFQGNLEARRMISDLEVLTGERILPGKTLLFIDEIQACPRAVTALRYLHEDAPGLHVIAAGSLLEFAMEEISVPVGRVQFLEMHPMTFAEYLGALGLHAAAQIVLGRPGPVSETTHAVLLEELMRYCFVGGMPECVRAFVESRSMHEAFAVQVELCESYRQDFSKYSVRTDPRCLDAVLLGVAASLGQQIKYVRLAEGFSGATVKHALDLLCKARVVTRIPSCSPSGLPLAATASPKRFKAIMVDVGMWQHLSGMRADAEYGKNDLLGIYRGAMAEQFVGQEMMVSQDSRLYYWSRDVRGSAAEIDYLAVSDGRIRGVEVKSGAAGRLRSLHAMLGDFPNCAGGLVLSAAPYSEIAEQKLTFAPIYFAMSATGGRDRALTAVRY